MVQPSSPARRAPRLLLAALAALLLPLWLAASPASAAFSSPSVSTGGGHTCVVQADGTPACWGVNDDQQTTIPAGTGAVTQVAAGRYHTCVVQTGGTPLCWGRNANGQTTLPAGIGSVTRIAAGYRFSCAIKTGGTPVCWGDTTNQVNVAPSGIVAIDLAAGRFHACAVKADATVACWGLNSYGQSTVPAAVGTVTQVSVGQTHSCVVRTDRTAFCWGDNRDGQTAIPLTLGPVKQIAAGNQHTCAIAADDTVTCWGSDIVGQRTVPAGLGRVTQLDASDLTTCAIKVDGTPACWGDDSWGQGTIPAGVLADVTPPVPPVLGWTPASPSDDGHPRVTGTAEAGATISLFAGPDCSGSTLRSATAAELAAPGLAVAVTPEATTTVSATATDAAGNVSPCSSPSTYTHHVPVVDPPIVDPPVVDPPAVDPPVVDPPVVTPPGPAGPGVPDPQPLPTPGPAPDRAAPKVTVKRGSVVRRTGTFTLRATCSEACTASLVVTSARKIRPSAGARPRLLRLSTQRFSLAAAGSRTVTLTLSRAGRTELHRRHSLPATVAVTARDKTGNLRRLTVPLRLR